MNTEKTKTEIKDNGVLPIESGDNRIYCLNIIGEIEGHTVLPENTKTTKYEHILPELLAVQEDKNIDGMIVILNTVGGDVESGLAIAELISGISKPTVSFVIGGGHSIGIPLAVAAKRSFISPTATLTVHPVRTTGLFIGVPQTLNYFEKMQNRIVRFVTDNSNVEEGVFRQLLMNTKDLVTDVGSLVDSKTAVEIGLIDGIAKLSEVLKYLNDEIKKHKNSV